MSTKTNFDELHSVNNKSGGNKYIVQTVDNTVGGEHVGLNNIGIGNLTIQSNNRTHTGNSNMACIKHGEHRVIFQIFSEHSAVSSVVVESNFEEGGIVGVGKDIAVRFRDRLHNIISRSKDGEVTACKFFLESRVVREKLDKFIELLEFISNNLRNVVLRNFQNVINGIESSTSCGNFAVTNLYSMSSFLFISYLDPSVIRVRSHDGLALVSKRSQRQSGGVVTRYVKVDGSGKNVVLEHIQAHVISF
mmetsp:Transcript_485/g.604  ORF Transcript_485/g.604 Transcript_485/m.604 type:complete len:248 (-) Transcript_485:1040-1783(-)